MREPPPGRRLPRTLVCGVTVFAVVAVAARWYGGNSAGDDTFIYMRYVANALHGHGYTFNPGERSFGITSPLWAALMTPVTRIFGETLTVWRMASTMAFAAAAALLFDCAVRMGAPITRALVVVAVVTLEPHSLRWASSGMENGLVVLVLVATAMGDQFVRRTQSRTAYVWLGICCGLLPFCRPELALISATLLVLHRDRRVWLAACLVALGAAAGTVAAFGAVLPDTAAAKSIALRSFEPLVAARQTLGIIVTGAGAAIALLLNVPRDRRSAFRLASLVTVVVAFVYLATVNHLVATRYASYLCAPAVIAMALFLSGPQALGRRVRVGVASHIVIGLAVLSYVFPATRASETRDIQALAGRVRAVTPAQARIALTEVGTFGVYADRYVIDMVGLVDRGSLAWLRAHGRIRDQDGLEGLLIARGADYYLNAYEQVSRPVGRRLRFTPVLDGVVRRNNLSLRRVVDDTWRLYKLERVEDVAAPSGR